MRSRFQDSTKRLGHYRLWEAENPSNFHQAGSPSLGLPIDWYTKHLQKVRSSCHDHGIRLAFLNTIKVVYKLSIRVKGAYPMQILLIFLIISSSILGILCLLVLEYQNGRSRRWDRLWANQQQANFTSTPESPSSPSEAFSKLKAPVEVHPPQEQNSLTQPATLSYD